MKSSPDSILAKPGTSGSGRIHNSVRKMVDKWYSTAVCAYCYNVFIPAHNHVFARDIITYSIFLIIKNRPELPFIQFILKWFNFRNLLYHPKQLQLSSKICIYI